MYTVETSKYSFYRLYATLVTLKSHEKYSSFIQTMHVECVILMSRVDK